MKDTAEVLRASPPDSLLFSFAGANLRASIYRDDRPRPGVLLLHTALGLTVRERALAVWLRNAGFTCMVVRYSGFVTGSILRDQTRCDRICDMLQACYLNFQEHPSVERGRVAVFGLSLGGYFATRLIERGIPSPTATIVWYGMYQCVVSTMSRLPCGLLIVQGEDDQRAFVEAAHAASLANPNRVSLVTLPGVGHQFDLFAAGHASSQFGLQATLAYLRARDRDDPVRGIEPSCVQLRDQIGLSASEEGSPKTERTG